MKGDWERGNAHKATRCQRKMELVNKGIKKRGGSTVRLELARDTNCLSQ